MKHLKIFLALILVLCMSLTVFACEGDSSESESSSSKTESSDDKQSGSEQSDSEQSGSETSTGEDSSGPDSGSGEEPGGDDEPERVVYDRVVVFGVDGGGAYFKDTETPNIDRIFKDGAGTYEATVALPSYSAQGWGSLLHGVLPEDHGLTNEVAAAKHFAPDSPYPSIFRVIRENDPNCDLASVSGWDAINIGIIEEGLDIFKKGNMDDDTVAANVCSYIADPKHDPKLLFLQLDGVDHAGHSTGWGSDEYKAAMRNADKCIGQIYDAYAERGLVENTLFIETPDHGGIGTSHGGDTYEETHIMWAAAGKSVQKNSEIQDMELRDTASVICYALGLEQPSTWTGRVPSGLFEGVTAGPRPVPPEVIVNEHEFVASPEKGSEQYVTNYIKDKELKIYLPFDGDAEDACGKYSTSAGGEPSYLENGCFGKSINLKRGFVAVNDFTPGEDSFTVAFWFKKLPNAPLSDQVFVTNKNWADGYNKGFVLCFYNGWQMKFNIGTGTGPGCERKDFQNLPLPSGCEDEWVHVIMSVDRMTDEVGFSFNFGAFKTFDVGDWTFDGQKDKLYIGQDITEKYPALGVKMDEFMVFGEAFTVNDVNSLKQYYNI